MNVTDPIADMLARIRNANSANKATVSMPSSKKLVEIARVIYEEGYIEGFEVEDTAPRRPFTSPKYGPKKAKVINGIKRYSKPGLRKYAGVADLPRVRGGLGTAIVSHQPGRYGRPRCSQEGHRRRGRRSRLVVRSARRRKGYTPCLVSVISLSRFPPESKWQSTAPTLPSRAPRATLSTRSMRSSPSPWPTAF